MIVDVMTLLLTAYGFASLMVVCLNKLRWTPILPTQEGFTHYQLHLYNSANVLEGIIRRLLLHSTLEGKPIRISFVDYGSTDDTSQVAQVLSRQNEYLLESADNALHRKTILIDLKKT
ncbi:hypothetical protein [Brevibacillus sp. SYSU BS000544]|uniref:hypothetical protein n=1 Tax=Brevibacillus sp. SYSU BS000544 TaxID=3416443 RepID=UPI003CE477D6